jgi:hypothetical protein
MNQDLKNIRNENELNERIQVQRLKQNLIWKTKIYV